MHSGGFELTKLTYARLEDNLMRHRGDRLLQTPGDVMYYLRETTRFSHYSDKNAQWDENGAAGKLLTHVTRVYEHT